MAETVTLGRTEVRVPRLGLGVMIWGEASGAQRLMPAKSAYGGTNAADEQAAFDASMTAEINFFDTAAMYSAGGSERRLGELAEGKDVVIATKFPPKPLGAPKTCRPPEASLGNLRRSSIDLYQHHFPSHRVDIRRSWSSWPTRSRLARSKRSASATTPPPRCVRRTRPWPDAVFHSHPIRSSTPAASAARDQRGAGYLP